MVQFSKLRLSGFKSFIDPTEILIEPGMTGIVGPNGCGKSNLVEAMRWVMGEISAKQMRGGEMDDVIFNGSANRPARNIAEVTISLDNSSRTAPAGYNEDEELDVTRRINRGEGSSYAINNQDVRARDVQLLFADVATGSRSTAIVSQGRIGTIINSKPVARRAILEEAAGITGLHSRRHEAELRLKGAETNLERLDDVLTTLEAQLQGLKRQARQATRYRNIGDHIRRHEGILFHLKWSQASSHLEDARLRLSELDKAVSEQTRLVSEASKAQAITAARLPDLRREEAEAAAALQRLLLERDKLEEEERRLEEARRDCESRIAQAENDLSREKSLVQDATGAIALLEEERQGLGDVDGDDDEGQRQAAEKISALESEVRSLEEDLTRRTEEAAAAAARVAEMGRRVSELETRIERLDETILRTRGDMAQTQGDTGLDAELSAADEAARNAEERLEAAKHSAAEATEALSALREAENEARETLHDTERQSAHLTAEEKALQALLKSETQGEWTPLVDDVTVTSGYEAALGAALGEDLNAPADDNAPRRWNVLPPLAGGHDLPPGAEPLSKFVNAPEALSRRLSQIGVVADADTGQTMRGDLKPGQRLVSQNGDLWRWDGYTVDSGADTAAATKLAQKNRLSEVSSEREKAEERLEGIRRTFEAARDKAAEAATNERTCQDNLRQAYSARDDARNTEAQTTRKRDSLASRTASLEETLTRLTQEREETAAELEMAKSLQNDLLDPAAGEAEMMGLRETLDERRTLMMEHKSAYNRYRQEKQAKRQRLATLTRELQSWQDRTAGAGRQIDDLESRKVAAEKEHQALNERPEEIEGQRHALLNHLEAAEETRKKLADALSIAESELSEHDGALKREEAAHAEARESRVRSEAAVEQAQATLVTLAERIRERLSCGPDNVLEAAGIKEGEEFPEASAVETKLERLLRERDNMGPVNLRAEQESAEITEQVTTLESEREDLISAIARLRQGIGSLNREGRERLLTAFKEVDAHFQDLFVRLYGGGHAHMELIESDDPLQAGLEIFASPPGKKLQALTLLSGGEQALTALSLLFAVFLTNPAPICVLDEVDAPLDDANVDRFCQLISEIAHTSKTRFLVVTHHRLTMARVDRLYGVTMMERGVSQIVSVDLQNAETLREAS